MIYVASPYTSTSPATVEWRYDRVCELIDRMVMQGFVAFSPIAYCHPIARRTGMKGDAATWMRFNLSMLRRAEAMYLLCLEGWENSEGVRVEKNVCKMLDIPVIRYDTNFKLMDRHWPEDSVPREF